MEILKYAPDIDYADTFIQWNSLSKVNIKGFRFLVSVIFFQKENQIKKLNWYICYLGMVDNVL